MPDALDAFRYTPIRFGADGSPVDDAQVTQALDLAGQVTDLIVLSHGWNNSADEALAMYREIAGSFVADREGGHEPALAGRDLGLVGVIWPSKRFLGADAPPPPGAASVHHSDPQLAPDLLSLKDAYPGRGAALDKAVALLPSLEGSASARGEYADLLRSLIPDSVAGETGDSLQAFRSLDGSDLMDALDVAALAETLSALRSADDSTADSGGVQSVPTGPQADLDAGGAAGVFGDMAAHFASKARALMNLTTYYTMKARAGVVGETGVAPVLSQVEDTRVHLVGHSFGARLVTSAAQQLAVTNQLRSISLLQAAFSHYSFSAAWSPGHAGFFRKVVDPGRVAGPMIITHTRHDTAVGIAYAMASALAQQVAAEVGGPDSLYGGLGSNGAQKTAEARNDQDLGPVDTDYDFHDRAVYNLLADRFVSSHSDVRGPEVAHAVLRAVAASE
jgi:hypothetical protein